MGRILSIAPEGGGLRRFLSGAEVRQRDGFGKQKYRKTSGSVPWRGEVSGWICEAEQCFLRLPTYRKIAAAGRQKLSGEFRRLAPFGNSFNDRGREESQANHATDVALTDTLPLTNFDHRSRPTRHQIVKPSVGSRRRLQDPRSGPADLDVESIFRNAMVHSRPEQKATFFSAYLKVEGLHPRRLSCTRGRACAP